LHCTKEAEKDTSTKQQTNKTICLLPAMP